MSGPGRRDRVPQRGVETRGVVTMWEAKAPTGRGGALADWARQHAPAGSRVYVSADDRVVIVAPAPLALAGVPAELLERSPHAWDFTELTAGDAAP